MQYILLIHLDEQAWGQLTESERQHIYLQYRQLRADLQAKGEFLGGSQLQPTRASTTVRVREGKRLVTDGPFAETREQLGGYFLIEVADLDQAIAVAARIPSASMGAVEIRPLQPGAPATSPETGAAAGRQAHSG
jgi:hypothetical protein